MDVEWQRGAVDRCDKRAKNFFLKSEAPSEGFYWMTSVIWEMVWAASGFWTENNFTVLRGDLEEDICVYASILYIETWSEENVLYGVEYVQNYWSGEEYI
jgi:hypothetical protein